MASAFKKRLALVLPQTVAPYMLFRVLECELYRGNI